MIIVKILGLFDIASAIIIFFGLYSQLNVLFFLVLLIKGLTSMFADAVGKLYGFIDIISALIILFSIEAHILIRSVIAIVLIGKGLMSLV